MFITREKEVRTLSIAAISMTDTSIKTISLTAVSNKTVSITLANSICLKIQYWSGGANNSYFHIHTEMKQEVLAQSRVNET